MANDSYKHEAGAAAGSEARVIQSPFCGALRSKKFFMIDGLATKESDYLDASNYCWCRETQHVIGPDGQRVEPSSCIPGRSCYSSALEGN